MFEHNTFEVNDTTKLFGSFYLHHGKVKKGKFKIGDSVTAKIDSYKRQLIKCNHSSTHLLHASLRKILGNHVSQKGSLVNSEKLRFDFSHNEPITSDNIIKIENFVKKEITANSQIEIKTIDHQKALDEGATALFGEKYGDEVRVVSMGTLEGNKIISKELCGGTHVAQTGDILNFKIINQTSVASGIRRIEALTNIAVDEYNKQKIELDKKTLKQNLDKISTLISEIKEYDNNFDYSYDQNSDLTNNLKELKKLLDQKKQNKNKETSLQNIVIEKINDINFVYLLTENYPSKILKQFVDDQKNKYKNKCASLIISKNCDKLSIVLGVTEDLTSNFDSAKVIQDISKILGGKGGGGRKDMAQAGGISLENIDQAMDRIKTNLRS